MSDIDIYGQLSDLKKIDYRNTLAIAGLIELLVEKGLITKPELSKKTREIELKTLKGIIKSQKNKTELP